MKKVLPIILAAVVILSCSHNLHMLQSSGDTNDLIIWAHSDIQPRNNSQKQHYEIAFNDIQKNFPSVNMAITAGDLVWRDNLPEDYYSWMRTLRKNSRIPDWYEIAGNHDLNDREAYIEFSSRPMHYAVKYGNTVFIFLSDEIRSAVTEISQPAFNWWRNLVVRFQDHNIIVVTHAALKQSKLAGTINSTMTIEGSDRFYGVLQNQHVDIWLSAHTHLPNILRGKWHRGHDVPTLFVDISGIEETTFSPIESWIIQFRKGEKSVVLFPRNHRRQINYRTQILIHQLRYPFHWDGKSSEMISSIDWESNTH